MATKNTSYRVHVQDTTEAVVSSVNIENGAMMRTDDALYMGHNGQNVIVYPQGGTSSLGWARYDDTEYVGSEDTLDLADGVEVVMPNNAGNVVKSDSNDFYDGVTKKILGLNANDTYITTVVFKMRCPNANQTHLDLRFVGDGEIERISKVIAFYKGNNTIQNEHEIFQYYTDSNFVQNGVEIRIKAHGGTAEIWDVIYFIQRTQNGSLS
jgi:hypothetical protein